MGKKTETDKNAGCSISPRLSLSPLSGFQAEAFGDTRSLCHRVSEVNFQAVAGQAEDFSWLIDGLSNFVERRI